MRERGAEGGGEKERWARDGSGIRGCSEEREGPGEASRVEEKKTDETERDSNDGEWRRSRGEKR